MGDLSLGVGDLVERSSLEDSQSKDQVLLTLFKHVAALLEPELNILLAPWSSEVICLRPF